MDRSLVTPSAFILDGVDTGTLDTFRYWIVFKDHGPLTRANPRMNLAIDSLRFLKENVSEGIVQWGHLINEIAFCVGLVNKYGD